MKISMLIENNRVGNNFHKEHGLSIYMETEDKKILFDTGATGIFIENAERMGIHIQDIDTVIISHAHKDHSGGLLRFLQLNDKARIYISSQAVRDYYVKMLFFKKNISVPQQVFSMYQNRIHFIEDFTQLDDSTFIISKFVRRYPLVKTSKNLLVKNDGQFICDEFDHELALVVNNNDKLVVITGCSHNGVENMIETVMERFPKIPIQSVIGGMHLMGYPRNILRESKEYIQMVGSRLLTYNIEKIYTCHCTGNRAFGILKETMGNKIDYFHTGMQVDL